MVQPGLFSIVYSQQVLRGGYVFRRVTGIVIVLKALALNVSTLENYMIKIIHLQLVGELAKSEGIAAEFYGVISDLYCHQWQVKWAQHSTAWCSGACVSWVCCNHVYKILMNILWNADNWWCCHCTAIWAPGNDETLVDVSGILPQPVVQPLTAGACVVPTSVPA